MPVCAITSVPSPLHARHLTLISHEPVHIPGSWHLGDTPGKPAYYPGRHPSQINRELDQARSRPWQPILAHRRALALAPGEIVPLEIEILPSGTRFGPGETLRLVIQGRDIYRYPRPLIQARHDDRVNHGRHVVYGGGEYDSHLLVPVQMI